MVKRGMFISRVSWLLPVILTAAVPKTVSIQTKDTILRIEANEGAPRLAELRTPGQPPWTSATPEALMDYALIGAKKRP